MENVLAILMAGGAGERLFPLTRNLAKPGVPFGGIYRIIDFTLSNCINSNIRRIFILTQYKALELSRHVREGWNFLSPELGEFIELIPPMKRVHDDWYLGTADAVFQNMESLVAERPDYTLIVAGDHIYKMDYGEMVEWHRLHNAAITVATIQIAPEEAKHFGVAEIDERHRIRGFEEKPTHGDPRRSVFNPEMISASMGVYLFDTSVLLQLLKADALDPGSAHDFGKNVIPRALEQVRVVAYDFRDLNDKTARYWRDVGTLDSYFNANLDLVSVVPEFNLYDQRWPIRTRLVQQPPAKFVFAQEGRRMGIAIDSIVSPGCVISGGRVSRCVLSPGVRVDSYCEIENSILLNNSRIRRYSRLRNTIVDVNVDLPENSIVGFDSEADRQKGYTVTENGVVVVPSNLHPFAQ